MALIPLVILELLAEHSCGEKIKEDSYLSSSLSYFLKDVAAIKHCLQGSETKSFNMVATCYKKVFKV